MMMRVESEWRPRHRHIPAIRLTSMDPRGNAPGQFYLVVYDDDLGKLSILFYLPEMMKCFKFLHV
jgi:hypothetical protein